MSVGAELGQQAYILQTQLKKIWDSMAGSLKAPLGTPVGLPKLTFGQLVNKSTHHVWQVDYLVVGAWLGLGLSWKLGLVVAYGRPTGCVVCRDPKANVDRLWIRMYNIPCYFPES